MIRSSLFYVLGRYGASAVTVLSIAVLTRLATPADYGVYALVLSAAQTGYSTLLQWLRLALNRFLPSHADREDFFITQIAAGYLAVIGAVSAAGLAAGFLIADEDVRIALMLGIPLFVAMGFAEVGLSLMQSQLKAGTYSLLSVARALVAAGAGIALLYAGFGAAGLILGTIAGYAACGLPVLWSVRRQLDFRQTDRATILRLARYGVPFAMASALSSVIALADRYIIAGMLGTEEAGLYAAPYDLANRSLQVLMLAISLAGTPLIFRAYEEGGIEKARPVLTRQFQLLAGAALPVAIALVLLSPAVSRLLLGPQFQQWGTILMPWIVIATLVQGFETFYFSYAFSLSQRALGQAAVLAGAALLNIVLNFAFIPPFGLLGAAAATLIAAAAAVVGSLLLGRSVLPLPVPGADGLRILVACLPAVVVLWPFRNETDPLLAFLAGSGSLLAYAATAVVLDVGGIRTAALGRRKSKAEAKRAPEPVP